MSAESSIKTPEDFLQLLSNRKSTHPNVKTVVDASGVELLIIDDKAPEFYTSFDDEWLVFDSYNKHVDDTLQKSKTQAIAYIFPNWVHSDSAIPDLPDEAFPLSDCRKQGHCVLCVKADD